MRETLKLAEHIYRVGGDEFVAVYLSPDDDAVAAEMEQTAARCREITDQVVPLEIAMGYVSGVADGEPGWILQAADRMMYENKMAMKQK